MGEDSDSSSVSIRPVPDALKVRIAATFVSDEALKVHPIFSGSSSFDPNSGQFRSPLQFEPLAVALQEHASTTFEIDVGPNTSKSAWDDLFDKINEIEEKANETEHGPRAIFRKFTLKAGENKETIDPWINLIPDEYGLAIVKCAVAIALNIAEQEYLKREKLFDALIEIRATIGEANSKTRSFQLEPEISRCAGLLYEAIVTALQEILQSLPKKPSIKRHRLIPKWGKSKSGWSGTARKNNDRKRKEQNKAEKKEELNLKNIDLDAVLEKARTAAKDLDRAVDEWKMETLRRTGEYSKNTNEQITLMREWVIIDADPIIRDTNSEMRRTRAEMIEMKRQQKNIMEEQDKTNRSLQELLANGRLFQGREEVNQSLLELLLETRKELQYLKGQQEQTGPRAEAIVTLSQLLEILCGLSFSQSRVDEQMTDLDTMLERLHDGLDTVIRRRMGVSIQDQGQVQSIFHDTRFVSWLESDESCTILVDGNMESSSRNRVSAMSLLCANFVLSMTKLEPHNVCLHFFCGLHDSPAQPWQGPKGLLQSFIIQLLAGLKARNRLSLDFLFMRTQIKRLKAGDMDELCRVCHELIRQFSSETTVYCIIDGIQRFHRDPGLADSDSLLRFLKAVTRDEYLKPTFKVLMTVPYRSPPPLKKIVGEKNYIYLTARHLSPRTLTRRGFEDRLRRGPTPSPQRRSRDVRERSQKQPVEPESDSDSNSGSGSESDSDETT
ncbi:hypothetical protein F4777DRAFT_567996 [Nemania sp. FL0916]|nr:hypothetical protein F4777DRAFT_567996 [Nemania sp. FL0916]